MTTQKQEHRPFQGCVWAWQRQGAELAHGDLSVLPHRLWNHYSRCIPHILMHQHPKPRSKREDLFSHSSVVFTLSNEFFSHLPYGVFPLAPIL